MKKRSEVNKPSAEARTVPMFEEPSPKGLIETVRCGGCGLEQSAGIVAREGGKCAGCKRTIQSPVPKSALPKNEEVFREPEPVEENLSHLVIALQRRRVFFSLVEISALSRIDRSILRAYADGRSLATHEGRLNELIQGRDVITPESPVDDKRAPEGLAPGRDGGSTVTVVWGQETFTPMPYNTFVVGPFSATLTVREGEKISDALERGNKQLAAHAQEEFQRKRAVFIARLKDAKASS